MADESEEKTEEATERKLQKERKQGRTVTTTDATAAVACIAVTAGVLMLAESMAARFRLLFDTALGTDGEPQWNEIETALELFWAVASQSLLAFLGIASVFAVGTSVVVKRGLVFATDPILPRFEKIDPVKNFLNMFKKRALVEFALSATRFGIWLVVVALVARAFAAAILTSPQLSFATAMQVYVLGFATVCALGASLWLLTILTDVPVQFHLFAEDMKMTQSEVKHERKDSQGDPQLAGERKKRLRSALENPIGWKHTTFVAIGSGGAVGIHYVHGETPVPALSLREGRDRLAAVKAEARRRDVPVVRDDDLVAALSSGIEIGENLQSDDAVQPFARAFNRARRGETVRTD